MERIGNEGGGRGIPEYPNRNTSQQKKQDRQCDEQLLHQASITTVLSQIPAGRHTPAAARCHQTRDTAVSIGPHHMAMQISSATVQKDDSVQLLKQTLSRHVGLDTSHHLHRLPLRRVKDRAPGGVAVGQDRTTVRHTILSCRGTSRLCSLFVLLLFYPSLN